MTSDNTPMSVQFKIAQLFQEASFADQLTHRKGGHLPSRVVYPIRTSLTNLPRPEAVSMSSRHFPECVSRCTSIDGSLAAFSDGTNRSRLSACRSTARHQRYGRGFVPARDRHSSPWIKVAACVTGTLAGIPGLPSIVLLIISVPH